MKKGVRSEGSGRGCGGKPKRVVVVNGGERFDF
jgi:hypothetical protein